MLSGGDVRPLALVVIGRGQITTPYILVIPSEGDYCFLGRLFSFLCSILPSPNNHKHKQSRSLSCPPSPWFLTCSFCCSCPLLMAVFFACLLCFECCWLFYSLCVWIIIFFFTFMHSLIECWASFNPSSTTTASFKTIQPQTTHGKSRTLIFQTNKTTVPLMSVS